MVYEGQATNAEIVELGRARFFLVAMLSGGRGQDLCLRQCL